MYARVRASQLEESLEASELDRLHGEFEAEQRLKDDLEGLARPSRTPPRTPNRSPRAATTPEHWQTAICARSEAEAAELEGLDDEWRGLEEEHNDLLALLAQQELEKNALADFLRKRVGPGAVDDVRRSAEGECVHRYGLYVDYANEGQLEGLEDDLRRHDAAASLDDVAMDLYRRGEPAH